MTPGQIYTLIAKERKRQDENWRASNPLNGQYAFWGPHFLVLEEKVSRIRSMWYESRSEELQAEFVKIAAIAIRALEEVKHNNG